MKERKVIIDSLRTVASEIQDKFEQWDKHIEAGMNPVPIQDLDYWAKEIVKVLDILEDSEQFAQIVQEKKESD